MQLGEADILSIVGLVGLGLAAIVIVLIVFALRRSTAMSDELSKESKAKFEAITPSAAPFPEEKPAEEGPAPPLSTLARTAEGGTLLALRADLQETRSSLQERVREIAGLRERETAMRSEIETLTVEAQTLRDRLQAGEQEAQELRTTVEEQKTALDQGRDIALRESEARERETAMRSEIERLTVEAQTLRDRLQTSSEEVQELRRTIEEQRTAPAIVPEPKGEVAPALPSEQAKPAPPGRGIWSSIFGGESCANCGRKVRSGDRYCDSCGRPLAST